MRSAAGTRHLGVTYRRGRAYSATLLPAPPRLLRLRAAMRPASRPVASHAGAGHGVVGAGRAPQLRGI